MPWRAVVQHERERLDHVVAVFLIEHLGAHRQHDVGLGGVDLVVAVGPVHGVVEGWALVTVEDVACGLWNGERGLGRRGR